MSVFVDVSSVRLGDYQFGGQIELTTSRISVIAKGETIKQKTQLRCPAVK